MRQRTKNDKIQVCSFCSGTKVNESDDEKDQSYGCCKIFFLSIIFKMTLKDIYAVHHTYPMK